MRKQRELIKYESIITRNSTALGVAALTLLMGVALAACGEAGSQPIPNPSPTSIPTPTYTPASVSPAYWPTTGWRTSTPEEQGVDSRQLLTTLQHMEDAGINVRSMTVIRNGYIVLEAYNQP